MTPGGIAILTIEIVLGMAVPAVLIFGARAMRKLAAIEDVVCGRPADPWRGEAETPGIASRMRVVEERTRTLEGNGGSTLADAVRRTETKVGTLAVRMDDHVRNHPGPGAP